MTYVFMETKEHIYLDTSLIWNYRYVYFFVYIQLLKIIHMPKFSDESVLKDTENFNYMYV